MKIQYINANELAPNPSNPNVVSEENMAKLRNSISRLDHFRPVIVREDNDQLQVIAGWHRTLIARETNSDIPIINLGQVDDQQAREITLADNSRYGSNDPELFTEVMRSMEIPLDDLADFIPGQISDLDFDMDQSSIDLDTLGLEDEDTKADQTRSAPTHKTLKFRVPIADAHVVEDEIDRVIDEQGFGDETSAQEAAGNALVWVFINNNQSQMTE